MHEVVSALRSAIDRLTALDHTTLSDTELHELTIALQQARARLAVACAPTLDAWDRRQVWADNGSLSAAARLARDCRTSLSTAKTELRRARNLDAMPATAAAVVDGRCSLDHVDLLTRGRRPWRAERFEHDEASLVSTIEGLIFEDATKAVTYWCRRADAAARHTEQPPPVAELRVSPTIDDTVVINGVLDAVSGAIVTKELDRLERELYLADRAAGVERTKVERRAAALVEMAIRSASTPADAQRPKPLFTVKVGDRSFRDLCELDGSVIDPKLLPGWLTDTVYETVLFDGRTTIVSVSQQRTIRGVLRRAIEARDDHCQHPAGCATPVHHCDVDHIVPAARHGRGSQFNTRIQCPPHNRHRDKHDHDATPWPERRIDRLLEARLRIRWQYLQDHPLDDET